MTLTFKHLALPVETFKLKLTSKGSCFRVLKVDMLNGCLNIWLDSQDSQPWRAYYVLLDLNKSYAYDQTQLQPYGAVFDGAQGYAFYEVLDTNLKAILFTASDVIHEVQI